MPRSLFRPGIELLDDRRVPALLLGLDGAGRLHSVTAPDYAQTADVTLTAQPGNELTVAEGGTVYGTFPVARSLTIDLGDNTAGFINRLDLNNNILRANVRVELGDMPGLNQFRLTTAAGGTATLDGNYSVRGGDTGSEFVVFGEFGQTAPRTVDVTGSVKVDMGGGGQDPNAGPPDAVSTVGTGPNNTVLNVGRHLRVTGSTVLALRGSVVGNLASDSSDKEVGQLVILGNFDLPFEVGGNVNVATGGGDDEVDVQGVVIGGNTRVRTGGGNDTLALDDGDLVSEAPSRLGGNLVVDLGEGNDRLYFEAVEVRGHSIAVDAGAGNDEVHVAVEDTRFPDDSRGEQLRAPKARMHVLLGEGNDVFRFADGALVELAGLVVDGGPGGDTYDAGVGNDFGFPIRLRNFP